jgi:hypothetical protein
MFAGLKLMSSRDRIDRWVVDMLKDSRYSDYFAERLARSLVGVEGGPFIIFRRDRMTAWLAEQLRKDASWSEMTRELIAAEGLWTDSPAANFITIARQDDETINVNKLAGRSVRTFLGQRIDCAQCHDHPFDQQWKQHHFEELAAFFCQAGVTFGGVTDSRLDDKKQKVVYKVVDPGKEESEAQNYSGSSAIQLRMAASRRWIETSPGGMDHPQGESSLRTRDCESRLGIHVWQTAA